MSDRPDRHAWFKSIVLPHESALRMRVRQLVRTPDVDVDDVVAEALIRAYQTQDYARIVRGRAFLFTIARNLLVDLARQRAVISFDLVANLEAFDTSDETASPESVVIAREELRQLQNVVERLPAQCRQVFILRRIEELSMADIAGQLGLSVSTVEKHLSKAIALVTRGMVESESTAKENLQDRRAPWKRTKDGR